MDAKQTLVRVHQLIALATRNSEENEARTAAVLACRMIVDNNLSLSIGPYTAQPQERSQPRPPPPPPKAEPSRGHANPVYRKRDLKWRQYDSRWNSCCRQCGSTILPGNPIMWSLGFGALHVNCWDKMSEDEVITPVDYEKAAEQMKDKKQNGNEARYRR